MPDPTPTPDPEAIALPHGRSLSLHAPSGEAGEHTLSICDASGSLEIEIELRAEGPRLRVRATSLEITAAADISLSCERFELRCREDLRLVSDGDFSSSVAGDMHCRAAGHAHWEGRSTRIRARRGELQIDAHDDVRIDGETVLLNS